MLDLRVLSVMFSPMLLQINRVRVNRWVYRCVRMFVFETKSCNNSFEGEWMREGFILFRSGWSLLE